MTAEGLLSEEGDMRRRRRIVLMLVAALLAVGTIAAVALVSSHGAEAPEQTPEPAPEAEAESDAEDAEERPVITERSAVPVTMAEAPVSVTTTDDGLTVTAPEAFLDTDELAEVQRQIHALEQDRGASVSVVLLDLQTRRGITYNADVSRYPASSIKAVYCTWVYESHGNVGELSAVAENCLVNSDNDAYHELLDAYGQSAYASWLASRGAPVAAEQADYYYYPNLPASELATLWEETWRFGTSGEPGADELARYLAQTYNSPIAGELRDTCEVWSKPGWYPLDENNVPASNDAGVVFSAEGPYVMVVMTDLSSDLDALRPLIDALDAAHTCMCGDTVAYYETD